jgi:formylglycine-generating enzyme required for sulfatase activity
MVLTTCILLFLVLALAALWTGFDWPPPRLILKYGFPPAGGPTGRTMTIEGVEFMELKPGYFRMGSQFLGRRGDLLGRLSVLLGLPWGVQPKSRGNEAPAHWVELKEPYWIGVSEITNGQYERFDPDHERSYQGTDDPVSGVTWEDAQAYCAWLSKQSGFLCSLPSEAQWENACRAGATKEYCFGDSPVLLGEYAWYGWYDRTDNWEGMAHEVRTRRPNVWGLYDLHGNVWEWCADRWHEDYTHAPKVAAVSEEGVSPFRVIRGGSWEYPAILCRSAYRDRRHAGMRWAALGFRPAASWSNQ